jgi:hypothetical protein
VYSAGVLVLAFLLLMLAVVGVFINIPIVSNYALWFAIAAYVVRDWFLRSLANSAPHCSAHVQIRPAI